MHKYYGCCAYYVPDVILVLDGIGDISTPSHSRLVVVACCVVVAFVLDVEVSWSHVLVMGWRMVFTGIIG